MSVVQNHRKRQGRSPAERSYDAGFRSGLKAAADAIRGGTTLAELYKWHASLRGFGGRRRHSKRPTLTTAEGGR